MMQGWAVMPSRKTGSTGRPKGLFRISINGMSSPCRVQYTSGSFTRLGGFWDGWRGKLFKEWTLTATALGGERFAADARDSCSGEGNWHHGTVETERDGSAALCGTERGIPQLPMPLKLLTGAMGKCGTQLDHRAGPVQLECVADPDVPHQ